MLSHFLIATLLSHFAILLQWFQPFYSVILLSCQPDFATLNSTIFAIVLSYFLIATILIHSSLIQCSVIFFIARVLSHILIAILLSHSSLIQCSIIPHCYSAQSFFTATVFSNSLCYSTCVTTRVGGDSVGGVACAGGGSRLGCGHTRPCGTESRRVRCAWLDRSVGSLGPGDGPVHYPRWWIGAIYIYIYIYCIFIIHQGAAQVITAPCPSSPSSGPITCTQPRPCHRACVELSTRRAPPQPTPTTLFIRG
jgi:hypothetical protein